MADTPEIRTALCQSLVRLIRALPPDKLQRVLPRVSADALSRIESSSRLGWMPVQEHLALLDAVRTLGGDADFRRFHAGLVAAFLEHPFMKTLFDTSVRLFGFKPVSVISWIPAGWRAVFRNAGYTEFEKGSAPREVWIRLHQLPPEVGRSGTMFLALASLIEACIQLTKGSGRVEIVESDAVRGEAVCRVLLDA